MGLWDEYLSLSAGPISRKEAREIGSKRSVSMKGYPRGRLLEKTMRINPHVDYDRAHAFWS